MKSIYTLVAGTLLLASCAENEHPVFNDNDAFVAFKSSSVGVAENVSGGQVQIPVLLTSLSGISTSVDFEVIESTAIEGVHFSIEGSKTLTFDKENPTQYITVNVIDNDSYDGNVSFSINLLEPQGVNLGSDVSCSVSIEDNEHPLAFILGDYAASADSYFSSRGHFDWTITLSRDAEDDGMVWINGLDPYFAVNGFYGPLYGVVNDEKTEIRVPVGQSYGYQNTELVGFTGPDPDDSSTMDTGDNIIITIQNEGAALTVEHAFGIYDEGWWNIMYGGLTITKK